MRGLITACASAALLSLPHKLGSTLSCWNNAMHFRIETKALEAGKRFALDLVKHCKHVVISVATSTLVLQLAVALKGLL